MKNVYFATKHKIGDKYFAKVVKKPYYKENMAKPFFGTKYCYYSIMCPTGEEAERLVKSWNKKYKTEGILYEKKVVKDAGINNTGIKDAESEE